MIFIISELYLKGEFLKMDAHIFLEPPEGFCPDATIVGCSCWWDGRLLMLKRSPNVLAGGRWCLPGGKREEGESRIDGALRELYEEVGITLKAADLSLFTTLYIDRGDFRYDFTIYRSLFEEKPALDIHLQEHTEGKWVTQEEAFELPLIHGGDKVLKHCFTQVAS